MDISIKSLKDYVFSPKTEALRVSRAADIVSHNMVVTEKIDGTKLTLVRANKTSDMNYADNWIVSYKGTILHSEEFGHLTPKDKENVKTKSIGISQYAFIFDHLKKIQPNVRKIPEGTEFSIEFAQNKETLTRTYANLGGMFLRSYAPTEYRVVSGHLHTNPTGEEVTDVAKLKNVSKLLGIETFPVLFQGKLNQASVAKNPQLTGMAPDWTNPLSVLEKFSEKMLTVPSALGGKPEGVVMKLDDDRFFKVVQADQYDQEARGEKKALYGMDAEKTSKYFQSIRSLLAPILKKVGVGVASDPQILAAVNQEVSRMPAAALPKHEKKDELQVRDDIHDTLRLLLSKQKLLGSGTKTLGLVPIAGKPLHLGHWKLIEKAAKENDNVIVYTTIKDRIKSGEFPIKGADFMKIWHDIFIPALPKNVKVKFMESPVRAVMHELGWLEQTATQDAAKTPTVSLYSDSSDVETNFPDEEVKKYPHLNVKKVGVDRSSTVNISGTKMREFLQNGDEASFLKYLPPVSPSDKKEIWDKLNKNKPKDAMKEFIDKIVSEVINKMDTAMKSEGGWRSTETQKTTITPKTVESAIAVFDKFVAEFNAFSGLPPIKSNGPVGSATYYKSDMADPDTEYGDIDMQIVLPVETNDRATQLESNALYGKKIVEFVKTKKPPYLVDKSDDKDFGKSYLIFVIDEDKLQIDLVVSYKISADWAKVRTTPERGLKGFVTGMVLSSLSDALNVVLGPNTNPYFNTVGGKITGAAIKKDAVPHHLNPTTVFLDIVKHYGKLAGVEKINPSKLQGHFGLDANDPSLTKKLQTAVALADTLEDNGIFAKGVIVSKDGITFKTREQFVKHVLDTFIRSMETAKTAKKLEKAASPEALASVEKIKTHADRGMTLAKQIVKEVLLMESGASVASVDPKTPKTIDGEPAQATTKLSIVDKKGNDIHNKVSEDIKELVITMNNKVGFWKQNNPYIEDGHIFNGSSQFLMDPKMRGGILSKHKSSFGDVDVIIPKTKLDALEAFLDGVDDSKPQWTPTPKNKITSNFSYVGRTKSNASIPDQLVTLWYYFPAKQVVQIDWEGDNMTLDPKGFEKPSEWTKFSKDSPWEDLTVGIKGLAGALLLRGLTRAVTRLPEGSVVLTTGAGLKIKPGDTITDKQVSTDVSHTIPSKYTLNTGGGGAGIREAYKFVGQVTLNGKKVNAYRFVSAKETLPSERIIDVSKIYEVLFGAPPSSEERASFRSFQGLMRSMKKHLDKTTINLAMQRFIELLKSEPLNPKERGAIAGAAKSILGITI